MNLQKASIGHSKDHTAPDRITLVLLIIYLMALCWILLLKLGVEFSYMTTRSANLIPFNEPSILSGENIMNVIIFIPLGIYTGVLFERMHFGIKLLFFFLLSLLVEGLQYGLRLGSFDVTDIINNTAGGLIGLVLYTAIEKAFGNRKRSQKFINVMAALGTGCMIILLVLLKMDLLPIKYR